MEGRYLVIGFASGTIPQLPVNLALVKGAALLGVDVGRYLVEEPDAATQANDRIDALAETGVVRPLVGPVFPLAEFGDAMRAVGSALLGKVVVRMNDRVSGSHPTEPAA